MADRPYNVNIGILGHVDSGKTTLVSALSQTLSTAALDKHPQSKERGITIDLGFSSFTVPLPAHLSSLPYSGLQVTLVDCPGHASLIKTIVGGAQIIDLVLLVIDVNKGIQTQTAECLILAELATDRLLVALTKTDLLPAAKRAKLIQAVKKSLANTFELTRFAGCKMVPVCAKAGGDTGEAQDDGISKLVERLVAMAPPPSQAQALPPLFAVDHCFKIKGQGTVMTGTLLQGVLSVGASMELAGRASVRKVKGIQVFRRPVQQIVAGDRAGVCVTQLDADDVERGLLAQPGTVPTFQLAVAAVDKVRFYQGALPSGLKLHIMLGHTALMAQLDFFGLHHDPDTHNLSAPARAHARLKALASASDPPAFDTSAAYMAQPELYGLEGRQQPFPGDTHAGLERPPPYHGPQWALLRFAHPVAAPTKSLVIGGKLDADASGAACRLALFGRLCAVLPMVPEKWGGLKIYKVRFKSGEVERTVEQGNVAIVKNMFNKHGDLTPFLNMQATIPSQPDIIGRIIAPFGKSGKLRLQLSKPAPPSLLGSSVLVEFKRYLSVHGQFVSQ